MSVVKLEPEWLALLQNEFDLPYMQALRAFLVQEKQQGKVIYPPAMHWFNALNCTPFSKVKVVILGQDPYHGAGQAHGLCFSVPADVKPPPSLLNIFAELERDLAIKSPQNGDLTAWTEQGVLLLNAVLTVEHGQAASHSGRGWERFTDRIITLLNERRERLVFVLWGSYAQKKGALIDRHNHLVLVSPHPSPLSAHRGFIGNGHFSAINDYLNAHGKASINWSC